MSNRQPNILLIILDTLRRDRLSIYGHTRDTSPEFDAFAADSTLFERAVAPAQWTVPAHASLFTGTYPTTHQLTQASGLLSGSFPTLAEILQGAGYQTAAFCNNPLVGVLDHGLQRGFDDFYNYASAVPQRPTDFRKFWLRRELSRRFRPYARRIGNKFAHNDTMFRLSLNPLFVPIWSRYINFKGNTAHSIDDLIYFIGAQRAGGYAQPQFIFVNLMGAHLPYRPPQGFVDKIAPGLRQDKAAYSFMRRFNADAAAWASPPDPPLTDWQQRVLSDFYDAEVAHQDYHLGRLLRYLESSGALDDTVVIIAADHGEGHGEHDLFGHGFSVHQELVHVPLIVRGERFPRGVHVPVNVSTRRLFHTILDLADVKPPLDDADPNAAVAGLTLARVADGCADIESGIAFSEAIPPMTFLHVLEHRSPALIRRMLLDHTRRGVYVDGHKLTVVGERVEGLYDVAHDPAEEHNLVGQSPALAADLQTTIAQFVTAAEDSRTGAAHHDGVVSREVEEHLRALGYIE